MGQARPIPVHAYTGGFLGASASARRIRRIMALAGLPMRAGWPGRAGTVAVWGHAAHAARGEWVARHCGAKLIRLEDAFLRSLFPGRGGEPPLGLLIDHTGIHFDPSRPSDLETLLATHPFDDHALMERARLGMARLKHGQFSKYAAHDPDLAPPPPGYVLVVDQVRGDASLTRGGLNGPLSEHLFQEMLVQAQLDFPGARVVIRTHPETIGGFRAGHFTKADVTGAHITLSSDPVSPWELLEGAIAVYTVSSQLGFEAILAGHRPRVWGLPFYAGWGLTDDQTPHPRRRRKLTRAQLFAGAMLLYPHWYDPCRDRLCRFEDALNHIEALRRAWREDRHGYTALDMRLWKRAHLQAFFGRWQAVRFAKAPDPARPNLVWGAVPAPVAPRVIRVEDGFLRSRGLGAELTPPLSLITDDLGLYFDPAQPSRLEALIAAPMPPGGADRAGALRATILAQRLSKYNLSGSLPDLPQGHRILVPGQVEDDASIRLGTTRIRTNLDLLRETRAHNPDAIILYKPHPDVEAGLRPGAVMETDALTHADSVLSRADPVLLLEQVQEVWTMTSTLGFEALLRGVPVTTLGAPFYAGWGLTRDLGDIPERRRARPDLATFIHAALIAYPRYLDPVTGLPCPPEIALERLASGHSPKPPHLRVLAKLQGQFATYPRIWRR
ncbi:MAG: capsular polysaccharide biosynthesis protein [Natronohydrobacter sp.]|nr:capsular polysaccharide biosynthesis protein [Natronohydrobacter sp.]